MSRNPIYLSCCCVVSALSLTLTACAAGRTVGQGGNLQGITWQFTQMDGMPVPPQWWATSITLTFNRGDYQGYTGVNDYGGAYTISGSKLTLSNPWMTLVEDSSTGIDYLDSLQKADSYTASNGQLTLYDAAGKAIDIIRNSI